MARRIVEKLFKAFMSVVFSIIQIICLPLNALFSAVFPDFTTWIGKVNSLFSWFAGYIPWLFSIFPPAVRTLIHFILPIELALLPILKSTHLTAKAWNILQKLKFW